MSNYLLQPDGSSTCCDCPDRESPCDDCVPTGACCNGDSCSVTTESDCTDGGGTYQGDDTSCDPNPCSAPCAFTISFEARVDRTEYEDDPTGYFGGSLAGIGATISFIPDYVGVVFGVWPFLDTDDGHLKWTGRCAVVDSGQTPADMGDFFGTWQSFQVTFTYDSGMAQWTETLAVTGFGSTGATCDAPHGSGIAVGGERNSSGHRSVRNVHVHMGNDSFDFPGDSFAGFYNGAGIDADGVRVDSALYSGAYAYAALDEPMQACCARDVTEIGTITVEASGSINNDDEVAYPNCCYFQCATWDNLVEYSIDDCVHYGGSDWNSAQDHNIGNTPVAGEWWSLVPPTLCDLSESISVSKTWHRINHDVDFTEGEDQFKLYFSRFSSDPNSCFLNFAPSPSPMEYNKSACRLTGATCESDCSPGHSCEEASNIAIIENGGFGVSFTDDGGGSGHYDIFSNGTITGSLDCCSDEFEDCDACNHDPFCSASISADDDTSIAFTSYTIPGGSLAATNSTASGSITVRLTVG